jgi:hypothetical protein
MSLDEASGLSYRPAIMQTLPTWAIVVGIIGLFAAMVFGHLTDRRSNIAKLPELLRRA